MASSAEIQVVLEDMRKAIDSERFLPINRKKNLDTLAHLGITWKDAKNEIYGLKETDYCKGPIIDRDSPSSDRFWVFKIRIESDMIYIKFKIVYQGDGHVRVVSFHLDE